MEIRKFALSLAVLAGLCSLNTQAQTGKKVTSHKTIGQRIDTLAKKVGSAVKKAEKTGKEKLNADEKKLDADAKKVGSEVKHAEKIGKEKVCSDAKKINCKVKHAEKADKAKLKSDIKKIKRGVAKTEKKIKRTYLKDKAKIKAWEKARKAKKTELQMSFRLLQTAYSYINGVCKYFYAVQSRHMLFWLLKDA